MGTVSEIFDALKIGVDSTCPLEISGADVLLKNPKKAMKKPSHLPKLQQNHSFASINMAQAAII